MADSTSAERVSRTVAHMLGRNSNLPERVRPVSRRLIEYWHRDKCDCGHASLVPGCHAPTCPYRQFWQEAANAK